MIRKVLKTTVAVMMASNLAYAGVIKGECDSAGAGDLIKVTLDVARNQNPDVLTFEYPGGRNKTYVRAQENKPAIDPTENTVVENLKITGYVIAGFIGGGQVLGAALKVRDSVLLIGSLGIGAGTGYYKQKSIDNEKACEYLVLDDNELQKVGFYPQN